MNATVVLGRQGRVVIPATVRSALELQVGDKLHLWVEDGRLVLERPESAVVHLQRLVAQVPETRSLVQELLEERRAEAAAG